MALLDALQDVPVIHCNDSRTPLGSRVDRHEHVGKGAIGRAGFRALLAVTRLAGKTLILETPVERPGDGPPNVRALRSLAGSAKKQDAVRLDAGA